MTTPNDPHNWSPSPILQKLADTGSAGFALQNATPNILSWTAPNDGQLHTVILAASQNVSIAETGGLVQFRTVDPAAGVSTTQVFAGGSTTGSSKNNQGCVVGPGTLVQVNQNSALTVGAATVWAQIWGA